MNELIRWLSPGSVFSRKLFYGSLDFLSKMWLVSLTAYTDINNLHKSFEKK